MKNTVAKIGEKDTPPIFIIFFINTRRFVSKLKILIEFP